MARVRLDSLTTPQASACRTNSQSRRGAEAHLVPPASKTAEATPCRSPDPELVAKGEEAQERFQAIFGENLKAARLKAGLKQSEVAALTGLTQQCLSLIEAGQQNVTLRTMALLVEVADHDLLDLLKKVLGIPSKE